MGNFQEPHQRIHLIPASVRYLYLAIVLVLLRLAYPSVESTIEDFVRLGQGPYLLLLPLAIFGLISYGLVKLLAWLEPVQDPEARRLGFGMALGFLIMAAFVHDVADIKTFIFECLLFIAAAGYALRRTHTDAPKSVLTALAVYLTVISISAVTARHPVAALRGVVEQVLLAAWFLTLASFNASRARVIAGMLVLIAGLGGVYGILQFFGVDPVDWQTTTRLLSTEQKLIQPYSFLGNPNYFGTLMLIGAVLAAALRSTSTGNARRVYTVAHGMCVIGLFVSFSRAAWLAACVVGLVFLWIHLRRQTLGRILKSERGTLLGLCGVLVLALFVYGGSVVSRLRSYTDFDDSIASRTYLYQSAVRIFRAHPLFGSGPNHFMYDFGDVIHPEFFRIYPPGRTVLQHTHSEYLQRLAETGILGLTAFLCVIILVVRYSLKGLGRSPPDRQTVTLGILLALLGLLFHALFSTNTRMLPFQTLLWTFLGLLLGCAGDSDPKPAQVKSRRTWLVALLSAISLVYVMQPLLGSIYTRRGEREIAKGDWPEAQDSLAAALRIDPLNLHAMYKLADVEIAAGDFKSAENLLRLLHHHSATFGNSAYRLGAVILAQGRADEAWRYLAAAERLEPENTHVLMVAAEGLSALKRVDEARLRLETIRSLNPVAGRAAVQYRARRMHPEFLRMSLEVLQPTWESLDDTALVGWYETVETSYGKSKDFVPALYETLTARLGVQLADLPPGPEATESWKRHVRMLSPSYRLLAYQADEKAERGRVFSAVYRIQKISDGRAEWIEGLQQKIDNRAAEFEEFWPFLETYDFADNVARGDFIDVPVALVIPDDFPGAAVTLRIRTVERPPDWREKRAAPYAEVLRVPLRGGMSPPACHVEVRTPGSPIQYQIHPTRPDLLLTMAERFGDSDCFAESEKNWVSALAADTSLSLSVEQILRPVRHWAKRQSVFRLNRHLETLIRLARPDAAETCLAEFRPTGNWARDIRDQIDMARNGCDRFLAEAAKGLNVTVSEARALPWIQAGPYFRFAFAPSEEPSRLILQSLGRMPDDLNLTIGLYDAALNVKEILREGPPALLSSDVEVIPIPQRADRPYLFLWPHLKGRFWDVYPWIMIPGTNALGWTESVFPLKPPRPG